MRAADLLIKTLIDAGTKTVFSLSGNQIMSIYDAAIDHPIQLVHTRHEAGAVYMADGYARATGNVGVALVTAAPGFTNALGPLYAIRENQTPLILLSGDSPVSQDGQMPFQHLDQPALAESLVKESWRITDASKLAEDLAGAFSIAQSGRPGIVHIALPEDVLNAKTPAVDGLSFHPEMLELAANNLPTIFNVINNAERPVIIAGPSLHSSRAYDAIQHITEKTNIPVLPMQSPRGLNDPSMGRIKTVLKQADAIILIDKEVDFTLGGGSPDHMPADQIVVIATNAESIAHASNRFEGRLKWGCFADPIHALKAIADAGNKKKSLKWLNKVTKAINTRPPEPQTTGLNAHQIMTHLKTHAIAENDPIFVIDGGEIGQWAQSILPAKNTMTNGMAGAIGGAIPQAIGAAVAVQKKQVIAIMGDGTAGFSIAEIDTARRLKLPITFIIANDYRWGAEVVLQQKRYGNDRAKGCHLDDITRYDRIAKGFGANGAYATTLEEFDKALHDAKKSRKPTVINVIIEGMPAPNF